MDLLFSLDAWCLHPTVQYSVTATSLWTPALSYDLTAQANDLLRTHGERQRPLTTSRLTSMTLRPHAYDARFYDPRLTPTTFYDPAVDANDLYHPRLTPTTTTRLARFGKCNDPRLMPTTFYDPWLTPTTPQRQNPSANGFSSRTPLTPQTDRVPSRRVSYPPTTNHQPPVHVYPSPVHPSTRPSSSRRASTVHLNTRVASVQSLSFSYHGNLPMPL
ncbi:hypothetical protein B0H17DRAFT_1199656 [Mycena rosella]|uniref:Uncharacterized protein n=1 Tax=Mycena rosella TaxID=1033263 RepID=A0AAD7DKN2_MYCRO|nr:hypothetical protein B0H17DRAFT_1199656 [Mycena rosella]